MLTELRCHVCERVLPADVAAGAPGKALCGNPACVGTRRRLPLRQRLFRHVEKTDSCWLWTGTKNSSGAGVLHIRDAGRVRCVSAPRLSWELHYGPIPEHHRVWHHCWRSACVRPDHLYLRRRRPTSRPTPAAPPDLAPAALALHPDRARRFASGRVDGRRTWWTRERVLAGLRRFHEQTGDAVVTSLVWDRLTAGHGRCRQPWRRRFPSSYAVLRHFPTFRVAWETAGVQLANRRQAPWTPAEDWFLGEAIGVLATVTIAADLGRTQSAIYARIRHLERRITEAWGWPIQRVSRRTGIVEHTLRCYIERGELPVFKGAKCVYVDPADLLAVDEIDWTHPPIDLELAALGSLRLRLVQVLAGRDWRHLRPHRPCPLKTTPGLRRGIPRAPRPASIVTGTWVRVVGPTPAMPQRAERIGCVDRVYWSINSRQDGPPQWRAKVVFARAYRKPAGTTITYCLPVAALEPAQPVTDDAVRRCP